MPVCFLTVSGSKFYRPGASMLCTHILVGCKNFEYARYKAHVENVSQI